MQVSHSDGGAVLIAVQYPPYLISAAVSDLTLPEMGTLRIPGLSEAGWRSHPHQALACYGAHWGRGGGRGDKQVTEKRALLAAHHLALSTVSNIRNDVKRENGYRFGGALLLGTVHFLQRGHSFFLVLWLDASFSPILVSIANVIIGAIDPFSPPFAVGKLFWLPWPDIRPGESSTFHRP